MPEGGVFVVVRKRILPGHENTSANATHLFGANRRPRPSVGGLVSVDGLGMAGHPRMAWPPPLK